jgi:hypothetical protein
MSVRLILFFAIGRLIIFFIQKFISDNVPEKYLIRYGYFARLFGCDLCLGFWVYTILAYIMKIQVLYVINYVPIFSEVLTGMISSFIMHIFRLGWNTKFQVYEVK